MFDTKSKKCYANKKIYQKSKIRRLWSKLIFSLFFAKTFLGNQKMDIYKCPKTVLPKKSWENKKYVILNINSQNNLKDFERPSKLILFDSLPSLSLFMVIKLYKDNSQFSKIIILGYFSKIIFFYFK